MDIARSNWVVVKFGGTSVSSEATWKNIIAHTKLLLENNPETKVWIVVSALSQVTNRLEKCVQEIENYKVHLQWIIERHRKLAEDLQMPDLVDENMEDLFNSLEKLLAGIELTGDNASSRLLARVFSYGELLSSRMGHNILNRIGDLGTPVSWVDSRDCLVAEDIPHASEEDRYLNAYVAPNEDIQGTEATLDPQNARVAISQGFIASTAFKHATCVLGRGGGDISGALFASKLNASRFEVWTDVHGMFTSDPRHVESARHILELSYREAQELAAMGAKVLHPRCLVPSSYSKIPVEIHNTMDFKNREKCTRVVSPEMLQDKETTVMAIAKRTGQVLITLSSVEMWGASGFLSKAFEPFDKYNVSVDLIATSQYAVSLTLDYIPGGVSGDVFRSLLTDLRKVAQVNVHEKCAVVSIVGRRLRTVLHLMADAFKELAQYNVLLLSESTEDLNLSFVVDQGQDIDGLVSKLHKVLLEDKRGLPAPSGVSSLFGSTLRQLLQIAPTTPELFATRASLPVVPRIEMTKPRTVSVNESIRLPSRETCVLISLKAFHEVIPKLEYFPLDFSADESVMKLTSLLNPGIKFIAWSEKQKEIFQDVSGNLGANFDREKGFVDGTVDKNRLNMDSVRKQVEQLDTVRSVSAKVVAIDATHHRVLLDLEARVGFENKSSSRTFAYNKEQQYFGETSGLVEPTDNFELFVRDVDDVFGAARKLFSMTVVGKDIVVGDLIVFSFPMKSLKRNSKPLQTFLI